MRSRCVMCFEKWRGNNSPLEGNPKDLKYYVTSAAWSWGLKSNSALFRIQKCSGRGHILVPPKVTQLLRIGVLLFPSILAIKHFAGVGTVLRVSPNSLRLLWKWEVCDPQNELDTVFWLQPSSTGSWSLPSSSLMLSSHGLFMLLLEKAQGGGTSASTRSQDFLSSKEQQRDFNQDFSALTRPPLIIHNNCWLQHLHQKVNSRGQRLVHSR